MEHKKAQPCSFLLICIKQHLKKESKGFSAQSVEIEHKIAKLVDDQRKNGFFLDMKTTSTKL